MTCTTLKNHGSHFTARIEVGTPPQPFDVVADTGSDFVIVASCQCMESGKCRKEENKCFKGSNRSSTFSIPGAEFWQVPVVTLAFGSGQLDAVIASDVVRIGKVEAMMQNGMLLMVNQALQLHGPFEGILGLGLPRPRSFNLSKETADLHKGNRSQASASVVARFFQEGGKVSIARGEELQVEHAAIGQGTKVKAAHHGDRKSASSVLVPQGKKDAQGLSLDDIKEIRSLGFFQAAGITRFSMCFNDGHDGVLRLNQPTDENALGSIGKVHWGLELAGIAVGNASAPIVLCGPNTPRRPGQTTACGAIPDSGTTVIMGPAEQLTVLLALICDGWEKCRTSLKGKSSVQKKSQAVSNLLVNCGDWLDAEGLEGLPDVRLNVRGSNGKMRELAIPPHLYIMQTLKEEVGEVTKHLLGIFPKKVLQPTGHKKKVCGPAFGIMEYNTAQNGPVWVLGTPIFYAYQVGYNLKSSPPSISFSKAPCGVCSGQTNLFAASNEIARGVPVVGMPEQTTPKMPWRVRGPLLVRKLDTEQPL